jgi:cytochrome c oxidase assembly protein subunit 11
MQRSRRNVVLAGTLGTVIAGMLGLSFGAVPLYRVFCQVTGYGGTPQIGGVASGPASERRMVIRFNADTDADLPWRFAPEQKQVTVKLGDEQLAFFEAKNESDAMISGTAVYNVTPEKVGKYFHKTACFCFNEQILQAGEDTHMPVTFFVDPELASDPSTADVTTITLSYTFFRSVSSKRAAK